MYLIRACLYIYSRAHTRTHIAGRIVGTRSRTHMHMDAMQPRASSPPIHHQSIHLSIDIGPVYIAISKEKHVYPHGKSYTRARSHAQALVATHTYCMSHPVIRTKTTI